MIRLDAIVDRLKAAGCRMTKGRRAILKLLTEAHQPSAALELHAGLAGRGIRVDKVTVYRELGFLAKRGIVHCVHLNDGVQRYELAPESGHKHHLVCMQCNAVEDVQVPCDGLHAIEKKIGKEKSFKVKSHALEFYGVCGKCA